MENNQWMPCMNCMMNMQPMMQEPMMEMGPDMEEEQLKMMYPKIYVKIMPLVKHHCDKHEQMYGTMHCPKHEHVEDMRNNIYRMVENDLDDELGEDGDEETRQRRYGRGNAVRDLIGVLLLNELIGRRRRRRRRPRPYYGWY